METTSCIKNHIVASISRENLYHECKFLLVGVNSQLQLVQIFVVNIHDKFLNSVWHWNENCAICESHYHIYSLIFSLFAKRISLFPKIYLGFKFGLS